MVRFAEGVHQRGNYGEVEIIVTQKKLVVKGRSLPHSVSFSGEVLLSEEPITFAGTVDVNSGMVGEPTHPLYGESVANKILVFPTGKGPTSDPYALYFLKRQELAPKAIINRTLNPTTLVGALMSNIPILFGIAECLSSIFESGEKVDIETREDELIITKP